MVVRSPSSQRRQQCKTNKGKSTEAADAAALTYLPTLLFSFHAYAFFSCCLFR